MFSQVISHENTLSFELHIKITQHHDEWASISNKPGYKEELYFSLINYSVLSDEEHINQDDETPCIARKQRDKNLALSKVN